jgi:hypothetical protein
MVPVIAFAIATGGASSIALVGGGAVIVAVGYKTYRYFLREMRRRQYHHLLNM